MNLKCWADIDQVLKDTGAQRFNVGRSRDFQSNDNVFIYDKEKSLAENKEICERSLERAAGELLYLTCWRNENGKTSGCQYYVRYDTPSQQPIQLPAQPNAVSGGLYGTGDNIKIDELTRDIEQRLLNRFEKERLERESKQLAEDKREFENAKNSALGLIASYVAPFAQQLSGRLNLAKVGELDADKPVHAAPIHATRKPEQAPGQQPADAPSDQPDEQEQDDVFTDAESETLYALMARFKAVEPDYLKLLTAVVEMAERGDATYTMAKGFLMK